MKKKEEDYYAIDLPSNSILTGILRAQDGEPAIFAKEETLEFGKALHAAVYELTPEGIEKAANEQPEHLRPMFYRMLLAAKKCPVIAHFLTNPATVFEQPIFFDLFGVPFKIKPDAYIPGRAVHDLKTTACRTYADFLLKCVEYGYFRQAVCYKAGTGAKKFYITGISKANGHELFLVDVSKHPAEMRQAKKQVRDLLKLYVKQKSK